MGSGVPPAFSAGIIDIAVSLLAAGGSTSLTVTFVADDQLFASGVDVTFSSPCIASGLSTITGSTTTDTGILTVTYGATGCNGDDVITANAIANGQSLRADGTVNVAESTVGSIEFESAMPALIGLRGTGGLGIPETSTVVFRVVDATGGPSIGRQVDFSLNTMVGGITLMPETSISGADGRVQTVIQAGTVATSIRVTATVVDVTPNIGSQSSELTITTGLPDQNSVSLSVECHNVEAWTLDGTLNPVTVRLSDRFNNPVPDGTAATLSTEGGKIAGSCTTMTNATESGVCLVNWISQNPRPQGVPGPNGQAGRSEIYMATIGEETFIDVNGNGFFDDGDSWTDLDEPFLDENENGAFDPGEPFFDFNNDQSYTFGDGLFSGLLCGGPDGTLDSMGRCATNPTTGISASNLIIMSGSPAQITPDKLVLTGDDSVTYWIRDENNQPMPAGTTISATTSNGRLVGPTLYTVPCMTSDAQAANSYSFSIAVDPQAPATGNIFLQVEAPSGLVTLDSSVVVEDF
jgi:hypothetical protein